MDISKQTLRFSEPISPNGGKYEATGPGGERYQLSLTPTAVHTSEELSSFLAGYKPFGYRADDISPVIMVDKSTFNYRIFDADDAFLQVDTESSLTGEPYLIDPKSAVTEATTVNHSVGSFVPVQTEDEATNFSPKMAAGKRCMNAILLSREVATLNLVSTNTSWAAANRFTLGATDNWNGGSSSDPIANVQAMIQASSQPVTKLVMSRVASDAFLGNDKVRDHMRSMLGDTPFKAIGDTMEDYVIPGLPPITVVSSKRRTTSGGTISYIMPVHCVGMTVPPGTPTDGEEVSACYTFRLKGDDDVGVNVREWFVQGRGIKGAYMVNVTMSEKIVMTGNTCGGHIATVVT